MFENRVYRKKLDELSSFIVSYKDSDLWVASDVFDYSAKEKIKNEILGKIIKEREKIETYIKTNKDFLISFSPIKWDYFAPRLVKLMIQTSFLAKVGPMASVAGAFSFLTSLVINKYSKNYYIENGGDLYIKSSKKEIKVCLNAWENIFSEKFSLLIPAKDTPLGISSSSGKFGHSISLGKADLVCVACKSPILSDAYATKLANMVETKDDIQKVLDFTENEQKILSVVIIVEDQIGIKGKFEIMLNKDKE